MRTTLITFLLVLVSALCAAQQPGAILLYDDFNAPWIDATKWAAIPTCSATQFLDTAASVNVMDCERAIKQQQLHLMVKSYGHQDSDTDRQFGASELYFLSPNSIHTISVTLKIAHSAARSCSANSTASFGQALIGGTFFNSGTGDPKDDVAVAYFIEHQATFPAGQVHAGAVVFSQNSFYGYADLGMHDVSDVLHAAVRWEPSNHQFSFRLAHFKDTRAQDVFYAASDAMPPVAPMKLLAARAFVPNCTSKVTSADMNVLFDDVYTGQ